MANNNSTEAGQNPLIAPSNLIKFPKSRKRGRQPRRETDDSSGAAVIQFKRRPSDSEPLALRAAIESILEAVEDGRVTGIAFMATLSAREETTYRRECWTGVFGEPRADREVADALLNSMLGQLALKLDAIRSEKEG